VWRGSYAPLFLRNTIRERVLFTFRENESNTFLHSVGACHQAVKYIIPKESSIH
jgi:hypothetical protein